MLADGLQVRHKQENLKVSGDEILLTLRVLQTFCFKSNVQDVLNMFSVLSGRVERT